MRLERVSKARLCSRVLLAVLLLAGCRQAEAPGKERWVKWPAHAGVRSDRPAMALRIPAEYAAHTQVLRDERGAAKLYLRFSMPGPKPAYEPVAGPMRTASEVHEARLARRRANINLTLDRDGGAEFEAEDNMWHLVEGHVAKQFYWPDGEVHGLKRYSRLKCGNPEEPWNKEHLEKKPADDTSPAGCFVWRQGLFLLPASPTRRDDEWVYVQCVTGLCEVAFSSKGIRASLDLWVDELPQWHERVHAARQIIRLLAGS